MLSGVQGWKTLNKHQKLQKTKTFSKRTYEKRKAVKIYAAKLESRGGKWTSVLI